MQLARAGRDAFAAQKIKLTTEKQAEQRERFALTAHFLRPVKPLLRLYFGHASVERSRSNYATSYHITETITGVYPDLAIDFNKVIIAKGELPGLQETGLTPLAGGALKCNWSDNSGQGQAHATDAVFVAVYNQTKLLWEYRLTWQHAPT